jgi:ribonuclease E
LKHDDPRLDNIQASYKMAEEIEDPTAVTRRSQEPTNKQSPVIKGVLPDLPAPHAEPRAAKSEATAPSTPAAKRPSSAAAAPAEKGFFGWLKNLFGSQPANEPAKPATEDKPARSGERREGRSGEGRNGDNRRGGQRRGEGRRASTEGRNGEGREDRANEAKTDTPRNDRPEGGREGGRGRGRGDRSDGRRRQDAGATEVPANTLAGDVAINPSETSERAPREKTDGRRGRGRRGERNNPGTADAQMPLAEDALASTANGVEPQTVADASAAASEGGERVNERRERRNRDRYGRDRAPRAEKSEDGNTVPVDNAWSPAAPAPVAVAATAPAAQQHRMPSIASYELPMGQLQQVAAGSGLEWVNSNPERIAQVQAAIAAEPKPVHVPRERPAAIVMDEGPLVLVETKRDLRQMAMPFDDNRPTA